MAGAARYPGGELPGLRGGLPPASTGHMGAVPDRVYYGREPLLPPRPPNPYSRTGLAPASAPGRWSDRETLTRSS